MPLRILVAAALVSATAAHAAVPFTASARLASKADAWVLKELATALAAKQISSVELAGLFLDRIETFNPSINAFVTVDRAKTLVQAAEMDARRAAGETGSLLGIPLGHKDAAFVRSHFDGMEVQINDAPRANEIMVAVAVTDSGRPLPRVGGLSVTEIKGEDGLR